MSLAEYYLPSYIEKYEKEKPECECHFCQTPEKNLPLVTRYWRDEVRRSANIECSSICQRVLFDPEAFVLQVSTVPSDTPDLLSKQDKLLNQLAINIAIHPAMNMELRLFGMGILVSKSLGFYDSDIDESDCNMAEIGDQIIDMAESGSLQEQFLALPFIELFQLEALRNLGHATLDLDVDPLSGMAMALKLNELATMSEARLSEMLVELNQFWLDGATPFFDANPQVLQNYLIHRLYHDVFPASAGKHRSEVLLQLISDYFNLRMLCSLWMACGETLEQESVVAIVSGYSRWKIASNTENREDDGDRLLLQGLSLLVR